MENTRLDFESVELFHDTWWHYDHQRQEIIYIQESKTCFNKETLERYLKERKNGIYNRFGPGSDCFSIEGVNLRQENSWVAVFEHEYGDYMIFDPRLQLK